MGTFIGLYIRRGTKDAGAIEAVRALFPKACFEQVPGFVAASLSPDDFPVPEQKLAELSAALATDVIWLAYQGTAGSFMFHHWNGGPQLRGLWYGCEDEGCWDRVEGQPEPWEQEWFWNREALENALSYEEDDEQRRQLERLWKGAMLVKGETQPSLCAEDTVHYVMEHYGLFAPEQADMAPPAPNSNEPVATTAAPDKARSFWSRLFGA